MMQNNDKTKQLKKSNYEIKKEIIAVFDKQETQEIPLGQEEQVEMVLDINSILSKKFKLHKEAI